MEGRERDLHSRLARGRIDVALTILRDDHDRRAGQPIVAEGYSFALGAAHPLAGRRTVRIDELAGDAMILRRHCELLPETSRFFTAHGIRPVFPARTVSDDRAMSYVRAGLGITMMPDGFREPGIARVRLDGFDWSRAIGLLYGDHDAAGRFRATPLIAALIAAVEHNDDI